MRGGEARAAHGATGIRREHETAVITGPTGEIGNALVRLLLARGDTVYALCRPHSWRLRYLPHSKRLHVLEVDAPRIGDAARVIRATCDTFYHFAWQGSYGKERDDPYCQTRNIGTALDAVTLAKELGCTVFVGAGSQAQYGDTDEVLTEDTPMRPATAYGAAKLCAETMTRALCAAKGLRHVWGRVASVYGPCDGPFTLTTYIMRCLLRDEPALLTPGGQGWDFLFADDAARAFMALAKAGRDGHAYCVASGQSRPLRQYIEEVGRVTGKEHLLHIGAKPYAPGQRMRLAVDTGKLQKDTGVAPRVTCQEGIAATWRWYGEHPEAFACPPVEGVWGKSFPPAGSGAEPRPPEAYVADGSGAESRPPEACVKKN